MAQPSVGSCFLFGGKANEGSRDASSRSYVDGYKPVKPNNGPELTYCFSDSLNNIVDRAFSFRTFFHLSTL